MVNGDNDDELDLDGDHIKLLPGDSKEYSNCKTPNHQKLIEIEK